MKRILLFTAMAFFGFASQAQLEIRGYAGGVPAGNDISGTEITIVVSADGTQATDLQIRNISGVSKTWRVERLRLQDVAAWEDYLCWGSEGDPFGQCYNAAQMPTNPWTSPTQYSVTLADQGNGTLRVETDNHGAGTELYRYYIVEGQGTRIDSVDVRVTSTLSVNSTSDKVELNVYPNPVANYLTISASNVDNAIDVKITDVLGKVVYNESQNATSKIDVSNFKNGVYLVAIYDRGQLIQTRRIVVKH